MLLLMLGMPFSRLLDAVIHSVSTEMRRVVEEENIAANEALAQEKKNIEILSKQAAVQPVKRIEPTEDTIVGVSLAAARALG